MNRARQLAEETDADALLLETATDNFTAQKLYEKMGYKRDEVFYRYAANDSIQQSSVDKAAKAESDSVLERVTLHTIFLCSRNRKANFGQSGED